VLRRPASALIEASAKLRRLATLLEDAQREVRRLSREVREAEAAASLAAMGARPLGASVHAAHALAPAPTGSATDAREAADPAQRAAERAHTHAVDERGRATIRAEHLCGEIRSADVVAAAAIDRAKRRGTVRHLRPARSHVAGASLPRHRVRRAHERRAAADRVLPRRRQPVGSRRGAARQRRQRPCRLRVLRPAVDERPRPPVGRHGEPRRPAVLRRMAGPLRPADAHRRDQVAPRSDRRALPGAPARPGGDAAARRPPGRRARRGLAAGSLAPTRG
jgi:hypothetical protein